MPGGGCRAVVAASAAAAARRKAAPKASPRAPKASAPSAADEEEEKPKHPVLRCVQKVLDFLDQTWLQLLQYAAPGRSSHPAQLSTQFSPQFS